MALHDLFLSCVSNEFHKDAGHGFFSYRQELADRLHNAGFHVAVQENFSESGGDLLQKLEDYIKDCRAVIHLVGDMTGAIAKPDEVHALLKRSPDFLSSRPGLKTELGDFSGISYTQWEALFALHHERPLLRYQATAAAPRSPAYKDDPAQKASQKLHWDRLKVSGIYPGSFENQQNLCVEVFQALNREHIFSDAAPRPHQPINNLPQRSIGSLFKGREDFMRDLHDTLTGGVKKAAAIVQGHGGHGTKPAAIRALGGVGKSRTAIEYGWQHEQDYDALLFVSAASPSLLKDQIAALTGPLVLNLQDKCGPDAEKQYNAALQWLHDHPRWFLIIDNVDTEESLQAATEILARLAHGHVCITTRLSTWPDSVEPLPLEVLTDEAGADYLMEATQGQRAAASDDEAQARALSHRLDGLALALEHAGAYIKKLRLSFGDYLHKLETNAAAVHAWHDSNTVQYPKSVAETWLITFEKLNAEERELLNVLAWLDPAPIPVWLVPNGGGVCNAASSTGSTASSVEGAGLHIPPPADPRELLAGLAQWHLIIWSDDAQTFKIHRLVQEITRLRLGSDAERAHTLAEALGWLTKAKLGNPQDPFTWARWIPAVPHALCLAEHAGEQQQWLSAVFLWNQVARLQQYRAFFAEAEPLFRSTLALAEQHLPSDHDDLLAVLNNLATLLHGINRLTEAETLYRRALVIEEKRFGPDHSIVATTLNNLAALLQATNRPGEAEPLYRRIAGIFEKGYGSCHPYVATAINNLAALLRAKNRLAEAEPLYRRALAIDEKNSGPDHPRVATRLNNLALLLDTSGRKAEAEPMFRRALAIREKSLGPDHPDVALHLWGLASVLHCLGRSGEALPLIQRAVDILKRSGESQGYVHPEFASAREWMEIIQDSAG